MLWFFFSFAENKRKNISKNISKNWSSEYSQKTLDYVKQFGIDALKTALKIEIQKTAEETDDLIR